MNIWSAVKSVEHLPVSTHLCKTRFSQLVTTVNHSSLAPLIRTTFNDLDAVFDCYNDDLEIAY